MLQEVVAAISIDIFKRGLDKYMEQRSISGYEPKDIDGILCIES